MRIKLLLFLTLTLIASASSSRAEDISGLGTRADIFKPQFEALSFRHMDALFPSRKIARAGAVSELSPSDSQLSDVHYKYKGDRTLADFLKRSHTTSFIVIKNGRIAMERYFDGAGPASTFTSWSVGKSFTSTLVGLALTDGKIASIDDPVTKYLPELNGSGYDGVPIKDVLQMSTGVKFVEEYKDTPESDVARMWADCMVREKMGLDDFAKSVPRGAEKPGTKFVYRSIDTQVLGWLVERVTGEHIADMLSERIWKPLGMEHDASWLVDGKGSEAAFCCINTTARDYARFGMLFLNEGNWNGAQLVPASWAKEATAPQSAQVGYGKLYPGDPGAYGYHWWIMGPERFSAEGVHFQFVYVNRPENLVIVKTSALPTPWDDELGIETFAAFKAIADASHHR